MQASYELITDNLMDLSHTAIMHEGILGTEHTVKGNVTIEQTGSTVRAGRSLRNVPAPGLYDLMYKNDGRQVDFWQDIRWDAPACMIIDSGVTDAGTPREEGSGIYGMHFLTPETETTTYYHFCAVRFNPISWGQPLDGEIQKKLSDLRRFAFEEQDQPIIKAQQERIRSQKKSERPVCARIVTGHSNEAIALDLGLSFHSVRTYRRRAYAKLNVTSQNELFAQILNAGIRGTMPRHPQQPSPTLAAGR